MSYLAYTDNEMTLRDKLAFDRTVLANERTLLAYLRTALALLAGGVTLLKFFPEDQFLQIVGAVLFVAGVLVVIMGLVRFFRFRKILRVVRPKKHSETHN
ncbi:MAG: DUF202 domain-containing protein [Gammaproteobacteria bacterium]|nr:DUF202 domain-containing protein [Gammaproteobacteria bacterium]NNM13501.1 DUF202 domain-containing protein [Gammaproteobacteria bacterium]